MSKKSGAHPAQPYRMHQGEAAWGVLYPLVLIVFGIVSALVFLFG